MSTSGCIPASSVFQDHDYFATSSRRGTPRKPLRIRFTIKQRQSDRETEEEVATRENTSEEATLEGTSRTSFRGLPCWSVTGRRGRKTEQSAPTGRDNGVENADRTLLHQMSPTVIAESTNENSMNLDPRLHNAAESDTLTQNTNRMEVASSNGDSVETSASRRKGKSIVISEVETRTLFANSTHNAAELEAGHQNGNLAATLSGKDDKSCRELDIYELTTLKLAVNISKKYARAKRKGIMNPGSSKPHQCSVCDKAFQMGQQLGGHMRAHFTGTLPSKRVKHNAQDHGSSSATAREKSHDGSSSQSVNDIAPAAAALLSEDTAKDSDTAAAASSAAGSVTEEMFLPHYFDLNDLPREGDTLAAASSSSSSSSDTPTDDVMLDLTLSL